MEDCLLDIKTTQEAGMITNDDKNSSILCTARSDTGFWFLRSRSSSCVSTTSNGIKSMTTGNAHQQEDVGTDLDSTDMDMSDLLSRFIDDDDDDNKSDDEEQGRDDAQSYDTQHSTIESIRSACFNLLLSTVGGGALSLPFAFVKTGILAGPLLLVFVAVIMQFGSKLLIQTVTQVMPQLTEQNKTSLSKKVSSLESVAGAAFGPDKGRRSTTAVVLLFCFSTSIGCAVLLKNLLDPPSWHQEGLGQSENLKDDHSWLEKIQSNPVILLFSHHVWLLILIMVTPLCGLESLSMLSGFGAASMVSMCVVASCIVICSVESNLRERSVTSRWFWNSGLHLFPDSWADAWDVFPIFIYCYTCHFNLLKVHSEFKTPPTSAVVNRWLTTTALFATILYAVVGFAGAALQHGRHEITAVSTNILLNLIHIASSSSSGVWIVVQIARYCMAFTAALALPALVIPVRDITLDYLCVSHRNPEVVSERATPLVVSEEVEANQGHDKFFQVRNTEAQNKRDPLLLSPIQFVNREKESDKKLENESNVDEAFLQLSCGGSINISDSDSICTCNITRPNRNKHSAWLRCAVASCLLWVAVALALAVPNIGIVWKLMGSSLSIFISIVLPSAAFLSLSNKAIRKSQQNANFRLERLLAWFLLFFFVPIMVLSTVYEVYKLH